MISLALKLIGCVLLIGAASASGVMLSRRLYRRRDFLKSFLVFISSLSTSIRYNCSDIFTLVASCAEYGNLDCIAPKEGAGSFDSAWKDKIDNIPKNYSLTRSDKQLLCEFGAQLGKTDTDGQLKHLELYKIEFSNRLSLAENAINKKSKLYKVMGFFAGTALALMII